MGIATSGSVLGTLPQMNAELRTLHATVYSAKAEAEDLAAAARDEWNDLNTSVPPLVEKLQARVNELSKSRKYPKGMDKAKFEEAKTGFEALKSEWTEASSEFAAGEAGNAVRKARDAKAKAEELMTQLEVKAIGHPLRTTILGLLHERAASITELASTLGRPKSTIAHHVKVLTEAGLVQVVRTRRVRAIQERFYGRTARMFYVEVDRSADGEGMPRDFNDFEVAARESAAAYRDGKLWGFIRHARISEAQASEFWERMAELVAEFDRLPRSGDTMYGFAIGVYPTDHPTLPGSGDE